MKKNLLVVAVLSLVAFCGCGSEKNDEAAETAKVGSRQANSPEDSEKGMASAEPGSEEFDMFEDLVGRKTNPSAPESEEAFIAAYKKAFEAGDREALLDLIYWDDMDEKFGKLHAMMLIRDKGEAKVTNIEFKPFDPPEEETFKIGDRLLAANLEPRRNISITRLAKATAEKPERTTSVEIPVGIKEGRYYFCGLRLVEESESSDADSPSEER